MKIEYKWHIAHRGERMVIEYLLLTEIERQKWFEIVRLKLWNSVGLICTQ